MMILVFFIIIYLHNMINFVIEHDLADIDYIQMLLKNFKN